jgi:AcrR family transcriptional regulator
MNVTKQEIVRSATKLFKERGFLATSVQDIADDCRIAKGSVYKYFSSKEDVFSEVFDQCQNEYFDQVERIKSLPMLTSREQFLQQLIFRFQYFMEYKLILVEFTDLPIQQDLKFYALRLRVRGRLMQSYIDNILLVYGTELGPHLWDLVIVYRAILREYLIWLIHEKELLSIEETAHFILEQLDVLSQHMLASQSHPLLQQSSFAQYIRWGLEGREEEKELMVMGLFEKIEATLKELPAGEAHRCELQEILDLLKAEIDKPEPKSALIRALLAYLEKESELKSLILQLKNIVVNVPQM